MVWCVGAFACACPPREARCEMCGCSRMCSRKSKIYFGMNRNSVRACCRAISHAGFFSLKQQQRARLAALPCMRWCQLACLCFFLHFQRLIVQRKAAPRPWALSPLREQQLAAHAAPEPSVEGKIRAALARRVRRSLEGADPVRGAPVDGLAEVHACAEAGVEGAGERHHDVAGLLVVRVHDAREAYEVLRAVGAHYALLVLVEAVAAPVVRGEARAQHPRPEALLVLGRDCVPHLGGATEAYVHGPEARVLDVPGERGPSLPQVAEGAVDAGAAVGHHLGQEVFAVDEVVHVPRNVVGVQGRRKIVAVQGCRRPQVVPETFLVDARDRVAVLALVVQVRDFEVVGTCGASEGAEESGVTVIRKIGGEFNELEVQGGREMEGAPARWLGGLHVLTMDARGREALLGPDTAAFRNLLHGRVVHAIIGAHTNDKGAGVPRCRAALALLNETHQLRQARARVGDEDWQLRQAIGLCARPLRRASALVLDVGAPAFAEPHEVGRRSRKAVVGRVVRAGGESSVDGRAAAAAAGQGRGCDRGRRFGFGLGLRMVVNGNAANVIDLYERG